MEFANKILSHPQYIRYLELNAAAEVQRRFCHHDLQHAVDVARVAYIVSLENGYGLDKDLVYSAALLHDIAKWKQYRDKSDHAEEGAALAEEILKDVGMDGKNTERILNAIRVHRTKGEKAETLSTVLYAGDKACRLCGECGMLDECNRFADGGRPDLKY